MSVDFSTGIAIGYKFKLEDFLKPFERTVPGESHYEDRYDPKTGKKAEPELVIDKEEVTELHCPLFDDVYSEPDETAAFLARIGGEIDENVEVITFGNEAMGHSFHVVVGVAYEPIDDSYEDGHFIAGRSAPWDPTMQSVLDKIGAMLVKLHVPGAVSAKPGIHMCFWVE